MWGRVRGRVRGRVWGRVWGRVRGRVRGGHSWSWPKACGSRGGLGSVGVVQGRLGWSGVGWGGLGEVGFH